MAAISLVPRAPGRLAAWLAVLLWAVTALAAVPASNLAAVTNPSERLQPGEYVVRAGKRYKLIAV